MAGFSDSTSCHLRRSPALGAITRTHSEAVRPAPREQARLVPTLAVTISNTSTHIIASLFEGIPTDPRFPSFSHAPKVSLCPSTPQLTTASNSVWHRGLTLLGLSFSTPTVHAQASCNCGDLQKLPNVLLIVTGHIGVDPPSRVMQMIQASGGII